MKPYRMRVEDIQGLKKLSNISSQCFNIKGKLKSILSRMIEVLQAENAFFFIFDSKSEMVDMDYIFSIHGDNSYIRRYFEYYKQFDPLYPSQFGTKSRGIIFKTDDVIPYDQLIKLEYYNDFLVPQNVHSELSISICSSGRSVGIIDFVRPQDQPPFNQLDLYKARLVADILSCFFQDTDSLIPAREEQRLIEYWADNQQTGIILINCKLNPIYCNRIAEELCKRFSEYDIYSNYSLRSFDRGATIPVQIIRGCKNLLDKSKAKEDAVLSQRQVISDNANNRMLATYSLIWLSPDSLNPMFIVSLEDLTDEISVDSTAAAVDYVPSKREQEIILRIADGLSNHEIANRLFISKSTVDTHIRNIMEKTGLKNRVQILKLLK
ncbi:MAG: LuxR C-terminal-related transcriptional regulator [Dehalococcoidales bacterium]|nr:LuxR C-terminal-related transcriptional regulator [Dehalococcoidales bacterium]